MAYAFTATVIAQSTVDSVAYTTWEIVESDVGASDEWVVTAYPHGTVTLYEAELTVPDAATTLDPQMTTKAGVYGAVGALPANGTPVAPVHIQTSLRYVAVGGKLYGQSVPDAHADTITTRVTIARGHR